MDHLPCSYLLPMNGHFSSSGNIMKQISWNEEIKRKLQKAIVRGKIYNQVKILCKYHCDPDVIKKYFNLQKKYKMEILGIERDWLQKCISGNCLDPDLPGLKMMWSMPE